MVFLLCLILISTIISAFGTVVGFGGGIFLVPILVTIFHYKLSFAVGSVMLSLIPSSLLTTWYNRKSGRTDYKMGILLEIPTIVGTIFGSIMLAYISANRLESAFSCLVLLLGLSFFLPKGDKSKSRKGFFFRMNRMRPSFIIKNDKVGKAYQASLWMIALFGGLAGTIAGLFGVGGGFLKTPIMVKVFKMPAKVAAATALFMIVITSTTGTISHYLLGNVQFQSSWPVMLGFLLGAILGKTFNTKIKDKNLEKMIGLALVLAGLIMLADLNSGR